MKHSTTAKSKELEKIKPIIVETLKKYGIKKAGIFGSYARGDYNKKSDVDVLIEPTDDMSLFDIVGLEMELKKRLDRDVDLLTYEGIYHLLKKRILKEEMKIL